MSCCHRIAKHLGKYIFPELHRSFGIVIQPVSILDHVYFKAMSVFILFNFLLHSWYLNKITALIQL